MSVSALSFQLCFSSSISRAPCFQVRVRYFAIGLRAGHVISARTDRFLDVLLTRFQGIVGDMDRARRDPHFANSVDRAQCIGYCPLANWRSHAVTLDPSHHIRGQLRLALIGFFAHTIKSQSIIRSWGR